MIAVVMILFWIFRVETVTLFTSRKEVQKEALSAIGLFVFNIFPDLYKGMLKGIIAALGIQGDAVYVHLVCHWMIYPAGLFTFLYLVPYGV